MFGSCFWTLAVILFQIIFFITTNTSTTTSSNNNKTPCRNKAKYNETKQAKKHPSKEQRTTTAAAARWSSRYSKLALFNDQRISKSVRKTNTSFPVFLVFFWNVHFPKIGDDPQCLIRYCLVYEDKELCCTCVTARHNLIIVFRPARCAGYF